MALKLTPFFNLKKKSRQRVYSIPGTDADYFRIHLAGTRCLDLRSYKSTIIPATNAITLLTRRIMLTIIPKEFSAISNPTFSKLTLIVL